MPTPECLSGKIGIRRSISEGFVSTPASVVPSNTGGLRIRPMGARLPGRPSFPGSSIFGFFIALGNVTHGCSRGRWKSKVQSGTQWAKSLAFFSTRILAKLRGLPIEYGIKRVQFKKRKLHIF
ncbi:hypothetical protein TNCT_194471 [Trichonephila clavata]|uniref:Uncharacterized protein n=1 Tax=Trichonephila clavata TaxID=2740835 RepID=A0A8X6I2G6_TRICU|nr:hypothetical protein TNCT_194471 [Trichonephila clavata]